MKSRTRALALLAGAMPAASPLAADVSVLTAENRAISATSFSMGSDRRVALARSDGTSVALPAEDVVEVATPERLVRFVAGVDTLRAAFTNGDVIVGTAAPAESHDALTLVSPSLGTVTVPFEQLDSVQAARQQKTLPATRPETRGADVLLRVTGDRLTGLLKSVSADGVTFEMDGKDLPPVPLRDLAAVYLTRVKDPPAPPPTLLATVSSRDGSTVTGTLEQASVDGLRMRCLYPSAAEEARTLVMPMAEFEYLYFRNGRCVYVSDLDPSHVSEYGHVGLLQKPAPDDPLALLEYPYQRDRTVDPDHRGPLTLRKKIFRKGLGVHSYCALTYALGGRFRRFVATVGVDDIGRGTDDVGRVAFQVWIDGKAAFDSGTVSANDPPRDVDLPVTGAQELRLVVDFGDNFDALDRADWAGARLIR